MHPNMFKKSPPVLDVDGAMPSFVQPDSLVHMAGTAMFQYLIKYRFYCSFFLGFTPEEESTVAAMAALCNILYCFLVIWGFRILPR
jgi:hypothetical protein